MSKFLKMLFALMCVGGLSFTVVGCEEDGPAEDMGETLDDAGDDVQDEADEAAADVEGAMDDAADDVNDSLDN